MEIEKKYKIKYMPDEMEKCPKKVIEQGYLCTRPVLRIRKSNEEYILTYKSRFGLPKADKAVKVCNEEEMRLDEAGYQHLKKKIDGKLIQKVRYLIPLKGGLTAELDVFEGNLEGLVIVEVEFSSQQEARNFIPPDWFGEDVTSDKRYTNKELAFLDAWEVSQKQ